MHVLLVGAGEYTVGIPPDAGSTDTASANQTDKKLGVVAVTMMDLRRRFGSQLISWLGLCGTRASQVRRACDWIATDGLAATYPALAPHTRFDAVWPAAVDDRADEHRDPLAYRAAIDALPRGSAVTVFTPDDTHFAVAMYAVQRGMHVMLAKPAVMTGTEHRQLMEAARVAGVIVCVEFHKRFDPIYTDARQQIRAALKQGSDSMSVPHAALTYFYAFMSQPKYQLHTFRHWAGTGRSDISFYLNSHHVDYLLWTVGSWMRPVRVMAMAARGTASRAPYNCHTDTEDSITLQIELERTSSDGGGEDSRDRAVAVVTACWTAPNAAECHSQQRFHFLNGGSDVRVDQAHRGYELTTDATGYKSRNPLFMNYTVGEDAATGLGTFAGQDGYGYRSFQVWLEACAARNRNPSLLSSSSRHDSRLAYLEDGVGVTAVLEAGRRSLDTRKPVDICWTAPSGMQEYSLTSE